MVSPLAPLLPDTFMIELERSLVPNLRLIKFWRWHYSFYKNYQNMLHAVVKNYNLLKNKKEIEY